jgi:hypothetical protein
VSELEKRVIYIILATLGLYLVFTEKGLGILKLFSQNLSGVKSSTNKDELTPEQKGQIENKNNWESGGDSAKNPYDSSLPYTGGASNAVYTPSNSTLTKGVNIGI